VAHARGCWFITQVDRTWRFPVDLDVSQARETDGAVSGSGIPEPNIDHLGDCDVHGGLLYVAMEGAALARVGRFDLDRGFQGSAPLTAQGRSCPWCVVDPQTGLLYSSPFDADHLEGLTAVEFDSAGPPWLSGVLHVLMLSIHPQQPDRIWLRHYGVAEEQPRTLRLAG
jgi:hypothetical protein